MFSLPRPDEKLDERLHDPRETALPSPHPSVEVWQARSMARADINAALNRLSAAQDASSAQLRALLAELVPEYQPAVGALT